MSKIKYIEFSGTEHFVDGVVGESLMEIALSNDIPGIEADCGGSCACGTCHVYIENNWLNKLEEKRINLIKGFKPLFGKDVNDPSERGHD